MQLLSESAASCSRNALGMLLCAKLNPKSTINNESETWMICRPAFDNFGLFNRTLPKCMLLSLASQIVIQYQKPVTALPLEVALYSIPHRVQHQKCCGG